MSFLEELEERALAEAKQPKRARSKQSKSKRK
jgi:hypothetical protein